MRAYPSRRSGPNRLRAACGRHHRVSVVGAGFAGLALAVRLMQVGVDDFVVLEPGADVGRTWRDHTSPRGG
jgi:cation diffusion facilitator CzcD-associated flavoprotein CzcO